MRKLSAICASILGCIVFLSCENVDTKEHGTIDIDQYVITVDQNESIVNVKVSCNMAWTVAPYSEEGSASYDWVILSTEGSDSEGTVAILIDAYEGTESRSAYYKFQTSDKNESVVLQILQEYVSPAYIYEVGVQTANLAASGCESNYVYIVMALTEEVPEISCSSSAVTFIGEMVTYQPEEVGGYDIGEPDEDDGEETEGATGGNIEPDDDDEYADGTYGVVYELDDLIAPLGSYVYVWYFSVDANSSEEIAYHAFSFTCEALSAQVVVNQEGKVPGEEFAVYQAALKEAFSGYSSDAKLTESYLLGSYDYEGGVVNLYFEGLEADAVSVLKIVGSSYIIRLNSGAAFALSAEYTNANGEASTCSIRKAQVLLNDYSSADGSSLSSEEGTIEKGSDITVGSTTYQTINWTGNCEGSVSFKVEDASNVLAYGFILSVVI